MSLPTETPQSTEVLKVLIADDDPPTRVLLRAAISQWGYQIVEAKDGEEAWEILQAVDAPRLLIVDWLMPKLDGADLCRRIKQEFVYRPYIILLTQVVGTANIVKGLEAGADEFLSKPFNMAELRSRLSVGTRIIQYENQLAEQNRKVHDYAETMATLAQDHARTLVAHMDMLNVLGQTVLHIATEISTTSDKDKITTLQTHLGNTLAVIKSLQADNKVDTTPVDINNTIEKILTLGKNLLSAITVNKQLAANLPSVAMKKEFVEQVLLGLLLNTTSATKTITITTTVEGNNIRLTWEDSGLTVKAEELSELFTPTTDKLHLQRLYLPMCKDILKNYNGTISAEAIATGGTRFVIYLPVMNKQTSSEPQS